MKKIIIGGLIAGLVIFVVGMIFGNLTAELYELSPMSFFKPMDQAWFIKMIIYDFALGLLLAYVYSVIKVGVPGSGINKGLLFGLLIFLVGTLPGLTLTQMTMNIRNKLIFMWALNGLINYLLAGSVIELVDEKIK